MAADPQSLEALAEEVGREARSLTSFLKDNSYYVPSFDQAGWKEYPELPPHVQDSRRRLQEAAKAVHDLAAGPTEYLKALSWSVSIPLPPSRQRFDAELTSTSPSPPSAGSSTSASPKPSPSTAPSPTNSSQKPAPSTNPTSAASCATP